MTTKPSTEIVEHYEGCLERHGDSHLGVDWPKASDVDKRYAVMLDVVRKTNPSDTPSTLLDFGCGASHLYEYMQRRGMRHLAYSGLDLSAKFVALCRSKFPTIDYYCVDILTEDKASLPRFDYVVMNGVLTEKRGVPFEEMMEYSKELLRAVFGIARIGLAFNTMSKHVDWERDDLFHVPFDALASFATKELTRHLVIRSDYGLYEYTTYLYREPTEWQK